MNCTPCFSLVSTFVVNNS